MLSYQHAYHAGNFADVHKHLTVHAVVDHLLHKAASITFVDTHAGRGLYPLDASETQRLGEYRQGVLPLWEARRGLAEEPLLASWLEAIASVQTDSRRLEQYPGSPWWLGQRLRQDDRLQLFELHPGEHEHLALQRLPANVRRLHADGLAGLLAGLPVATPRLCVLIDPSYERKAEYGEVAETLLTTMRKVRHAVVLVWYPLLPAARHLELLERLRDGGLRKIWRSELTLREPGEERGMYGSGMLVVNPPWGLDERLAAAMARVTPLLGETTRYGGGWWVEE
ncbi:23S rRNA (adenine(2030)-N(6))-methyltransferase RlmJ [Billgrantia tianxiuensis]|jgi:23S rRNA (adenine2030-N6)-methyltransferase|uniref:Ribosomal RNA large subunit methyltransferase J n=1 Tax=Billgrantia tianxiuensis TaxID=2497861 RepID=A0A6I6SVA9_9GAMM|nr:MULTISPECIES: 23S rRNA (adenine(2030)-N(6))-methyltransferase RlmJ [Halomonas]MCE8035206.1 23S rRNA (adenine(2030)-N(6))-methyltransferase RlmJ [Halomonas sp. MCCC 1A11057]QHC51977.1 23S rRNA (adenine(2030)-N(6))-methyltransferase RlmJ [Halomonas tianxiuensis]